MKRTFVIVIDHNPPQKVKPGEISQGSGRRDDDAVCRGVPFLPYYHPPLPDSFTTITSLATGLRGLEGTFLSKTSNIASFFDVLARHLPFDIREIHENRKQHVKERV